MIRFLLGLLFCIPAFAQLPSKPEDISPLLIGELVPDFTLKTTDGQPVHLGSIFAAKPTLLVVFRGGWCPFCNSHLSELADLESRIQELGFQILAVSPDAPEKLSVAREKRTLKYQLLSDSAGLFIQKLGLAFQVPNHYRKTIFEASLGKNQEMLPVPALFVLDKRGKILFEHIQPDFKSRIRGKLVLAVLEVLKPEEK